MKIRPLPFALKDLLLQSNPCPLHYQTLYNSVTIGEFFRSGEGNFLCFLLLFFLVESLRECSDHLMAPPPPLKGNLQTKIKSIGLNPLGRYIHIYIYIGICLYYIFLIRARVGSPPWYYSHCLLSLVRFSPKSVLFSIWYIQTYIDVYRRPFRLSFCKREFKYRGPNFVIFPLLQLLMISIFCTAVVLFHLR